MKSILVEFVIVVAGILVALGVDEWRRDREDLRIAEEHLADVTAEVRQNLCTVQRIKVRAMGYKYSSLQTVLDFLNDPAAPAADEAALLQAFARSTANPRPWLVNNQYQALQNSGNVRLVRRLDPELSLAGVYEGPRVLFGHVDRLQGRYPVVVHELIPAQMQAKLSPLRSYARRVDATDAPEIVDAADLRQAIDKIRARRVELLALARNESAVATANWYALLRIKSDHETLLEQLKRWDRSTQSVSDMLAECAEPAK